MAETCDVYTMEELMPLFLKLKPVKSEDIFGTWRGGKFDGCIPDPINWWGKLLESREYAEPLLVTAADGSIQIFSGLGSARMREVFFENKTSAALIYENQPIIDYFRQVNDDLIIGYGEVKGEGPKNDLFFWLKRTDDIEF